jgi:tetratricopeptide (TPR) repeat protein
MAGEAMVQGRLDEAKKLLEPIVRLSPESPKVHSMLGKVYLVLGELEKARVTLERAVELRPADVKSRNNLGSALAALREPAKAEEQFVESLKINANQPAVLDELTTVLLQMKRYDDALKHLQKGIELDPKGQQNYVGMSRVYQAQALQSQAIDILQQAIEHVDFPTRAHEELATIYKRSGDQAGAIRQFESAAKLYQDILKKIPRQPDLQGDLANVLIELQKYDEAAKALETVMQMAPSRALPHIGMGRIHHRQERLEEAERSFLRALELEPRNAQAHERLGALMGQQEKWADAEKHFRKALEIDPNFIQAQVNLQRMEEYLASVKDAPVGNPTSQPATAPSSTSN